MKPRKTQSKETPVLPAIAGEWKDLVSPEFSSRYIPKLRGCEEESLNKRQSAKQLDVQKNVLPNGFDSSTEFRPFFRRFAQKYQVAPFLVKNRNGCPHR